MSDKPEFPTDGAFSVVIPAHNEASVIAETLDCLSRDAPAGGGPEILVICNGCTDDTAEVARRTMPGARVVELEVGSKTLALNRGLELASHRPILFVDADICIDFASLSAVARTLRQPGICAASPAARLVTSESDALVSAYYRTWQRHPFLKEGVGGSGVFGLSQAGIDKLGAFPSVIADDSMVRTMFPLSQQKRVSVDEEGRPVFSTVKAPKRVGDLIACEARWRAGDSQLETLDHDVPDHPIVGPAPLKQLWRESDTGRDFVIYCGIKLVGRSLSWWNGRRGRGSRWLRDESRRAG